jgi:hypothetical protein
LNWGGHADGGHIRQPGKNDFLRGLGILGAVPDGRRSPAEIAESQMASKVVTAVLPHPQAKKPLIGIRPCGLDQKI